MKIILENIVGSGKLYLEIMKIICGDVSNSSMIDIGAHLAPYTPLLGFRERTYVDIQNRPLDHPEEQKWFICADAIDFLKTVDRIYDVSISSDSLEHFSQERGRELLSLMVYRSNKQIIFTPLGAWMLSEDKHPDSHLSAWLPEMLPDFISIVFPDFHPTLGIGAFFAVNCSNVEKERIINEIKNKYVKD